MVYGLKINKKEKITMNFKKIFPFGLMVCCLLGPAMAMEETDSNSDALKTFKCPTIEEIHDRAREMKRSPSWGPYTATQFALTTKEGVIFKPWLALGDPNNNTVQRALNLKEYIRTCLIEKDRSLKELEFEYSPNLGQKLTLRVDLEEMGIDPLKVSYPKDVPPTYTSSSLDGTKYIHFDDPNLIFTIQQ